MRGNAKHYFPGNNTPGGFFSYYHNLLDPKEAERIWCLKGGPGTGKSYLMKKIGETMLEEGHDVDFLHCSSDSSSLDGILLKKYGIMIVDGTSPHLIDPVNPGAVDSIVNLGDFWDEAGIRKHRREIIKIKGEISQAFRKAYNYLGAAEKMYDNFSVVPTAGINQSVACDIAEKIVQKDIKCRRNPAGTGRLRKLFATAVTPEGIVNHLSGIAGTCSKIYVIKSRVGSGSENILSRILEESIYCGHDADAFYCSLKPQTKVEHLVIPQLSLAVVTSNTFHKFLIDERNREIINIDFLHETDERRTADEILDDSLERMKELLEMATVCLKEAKNKHSMLESYYIPNMNFENLDRLRQNIEETIHKIIR